MERNRFTKKCEKCGKDFNTQDKRQRFCSRNCSATFNNLRFPRKHMTPFKRPNTGKEVCECGGHKNRHSVMCRRCKDKIVINRNNLKTVRDVKTTKGQSVYVAVRDHAKSIMRYFRVARRCAICGYSKYVEACHIKGISDFPENSLLSEVNSLSNLVYLCPNHHKELDNDLLTKEELEIVRKGSEPLDESDRLC